MDADLEKKHLLKTSNKFGGPSSNELILNNILDPTGSSWVIVIQTQNTDGGVHPRGRGDDGAANCGISALGMIHPHISWPTWSISKAGLLRSSEHIFSP